jgi:hypothetical protein
MRTGHKFYKLLKEDQLISFFKQNPEVAVPKELTTFINGKTDKNSSVLVEFTLKD